MTQTQLAYREYLKSDHWRKLRLQAFRRWGRKCFKCPKTFGLDVHHLVYRHPWTLCTSDDVRPCCRECHEKEHGREISIEEKRRIELIGKIRRINQGKADRRARRKAAKIAKRKSKAKAGNWQSQRDRARQLLMNRQAGVKLTKQEKRFLKYFAATAHFSRPHGGGRPNWVSRGTSSN